ncbi:hypothetical protein [Cerasicoccus maritimus]|uniref:hypothetical protein n=1 Tax=Cerasicoccus maritimus TaxID=490089 RepID=UPI0028525880|nr:hypothetical protein [Cerasicoccus maritimus]
MVYVYFESNTPQFFGELQGLTQRLLHILKIDPDFRLVLRGHCMLLREKYPVEHYGLYSFLESGVMPEAFRFFDFPGDDSLMKFIKEYTPSNCYSDMLPG